MSTNENDVMQSPIAQVVEAVAATVANPSIPVLAEDVMLAHTLALKVKTELAGKHPTIKNIFYMLLNLG